MMTDLSGQYFGDYRLGRLLGEGGFSQVYEADHVHLPGVKAAVKLLHAGFTAEQMEELRREVFLFSSLKHPHILPLYTFGVEQTIPYLVMEYAAGGSPLRTYYDLSRIVAYVRPIAQALHYAHCRGILHRALKPTNILLTQDGRVQVADFGLASLIAQQPQDMWHLVASRTYMAPEQFEGKAGAASDQYALAIIVYKWLCGRVPFDGNGDLSQIPQQHKTMAPPSLCQQRPYVPRAVEAVIFRALAKEPGQRFATIQAFADALEEASQPPFVASPSQRLGEYILVRSLGESAVAQVYEAEHMQLGAKAAIKLFKGSFGPHEVETLRHEARAIIQLDHPHIVRAYRFHIKFQVPYLIMAYAPGGSLATQHPLGTRLPLERVRTYVRQIAFALHYAHQQGMIHCNLKPANVLLQQDGQLQVADFGIVRMLQQAGSTQQRLGTWTFMAPEQFEGKAVAASDQYALAIMIYQWLCGTPPFAEDGSFFILSHQHRNELPPPLRKHVPDLAPEIERVILTALNKQPAERFPSVQDFADAFENACAAPERVPQQSESPVPAPAIAVSPVRAVQPVAEVSTVGTLLSTYEHRGGAVRTLVWSPDGSSIASGGEDGTVRIWLREDGVTLFIYRGHRSVVDVVAWSPDGCWLASASNDGQVQVWEARSGKLMQCYAGNSGLVHAVAWSPDSRWLAVASNEVQVWEARTGELMRRYEGHSGVVEAVDWSPDGRWVASASTRDGVDVWEASSGELMWHSEIGSYRAPAVAWSPDGRLLASTSVYGYVDVREASSGKLLQYYDGHNGLVRVVDWSPDSRWLAAASDEGQVYVWKASSGKLAWRYQDHTPWANAVAWSPDGRWLAIADDTSVRLWKAMSRELMRRYERHASRVDAVVWSPDGRRLASTSVNGGVDVWEAASEKLLCCYGGSAKKARVVAWSPDGRWIASGSDCEAVKVWDATVSGSYHLYAGNFYSVYAVVWSPDSRWLAASDGTSVQVWEARTGELIHRYFGHSGRVEALAWSPDGRWLASAGDESDKGVRVWEVTSGKLIRFYQGHDSRVGTVAWSPDGRWVASAGDDVQVWEVSSGKPIRCYQGHGSRIHAVAWSPDGRLLASGGRDTSVQVWEAATGTLVFTYRGHVMPVQSVAWSPDGEWIASAATEVYVWRAV